MAAHRYWRAVSLEAYGAGDLELSCFHLLDAAGARLDAPAALSASAAPTTGAVANLQDDDLTTAARWPVQSVAALALNWDFGGSPVEAANVQLAGSSEVRFLLVVNLQWSDDTANWTEYTTFAGIAFPGAGAKTQNIFALLPNDPVNTCLAFEGANDSTTIVDKKGKAWAAFGNARLSTAASLMGVSSLDLDGAGAYVSTASGYADFAFGTGDFVLTVLALFPAAAREMVLFDYFTPNGAGSSWQVEVMPSGALSWYRGATSAGTLLTGVKNLRDGVKHHIEVSRTGGILRFFVDGLLDASVADTADYSNTGAGLFSIGAQVATRNATYDTLGTIDELSYTKGAGGHTAAFTPPTTERGQFIVRLNTVQGRAASIDLITAGTGPTVIYGIPQVVEPVNLTVQSGAVKDYITGVLGTGRGRVSGVVREKGTPNAPVYRKVRLIREKDGMVIRELWSHPTTGAYSFGYIDELQSWAVQAHDHTFAFRDQIASNLTLANGGVELIP